MIDRLMDIRSVNKNVIFIYQIKQAKNSKNRKKKLTKKSIKNIKYLGIHSLKNVQHFFTKKKKALLSS